MAGVRTSDAHKERVRAIISGAYASAMQRPAPKIVESSTPIEPRKVKNGCPRLRHHAAAYSKGRTI